MNSLYYVQDSRYFLGNTVVWLAWDGSYTGDINKARVFTAVEARDAIEAKDFCVLWLKDYIDQHVQSTVDMKDIDRRVGERSINRIFSSLPTCSNCDDVITEATCYLHGCDRWNELQRKGKPE